MKVKIHLAENCPIEAKGFAEYPNACRASFMQGPVCDVTGQASKFAEGAQADRLFALAR